MADSTIAWVGDLTQVVRYTSLCKTTFLESLGLPRSRKPGLKTLKKLFYTDSQKPQWFPCPHANGERVEKSDVSKYLIIFVA
jgi:hypothetical protein